jgi:hypothetical protein
MLLTDSHSIRDVILLPLLRLETRHESAPEENPAAESANAPDSSAKKP